MTLASTLRPTTDRSPAPTSAGAPVVTVVIPTRHEAGTVDELVERTRRALAATGATYEILFVDDSDDATPEAISVHERAGAPGPTPAPARRRAIRWRRRRALRRIRGRARDVRPLARRRPPTPARAPGDHGAGPHRPAGRRRRRDPVRAGRRDRGRRHVVATHDVRRRPRPHPRRAPEVAGDHGPRQRILRVRPHHPHRGRAANARLPDPRRAARPGRLGASRGGAVPRRARVRTAGRAPRRATGARYLRQLLGLAADPSVVRAKAPTPEVLARLSLDPEGAPDGPGALVLCPPASAVTAPDPVALIRPSSTAQPRRRPRATCRTT